MRKKNEYSTIEHKSLLQMLKPWILVKFLMKCVTKSNFVCGSNIFIVTLNQRGAPIISDNSYNRFCKKRKDNKDKHLVFILGSSRVSWHNWLVMGRQYCLLSITTIPTRSIFGYLWQIRRTNFAIQELHSCYRYLGQDLF